MKEIITLKKEYMTLGQVLKEGNLIGSGGQAKWFLQERTVFVNDEPENRRGRKIYDGDRVEIPDEVTFFVQKEASKADDSCI